MLDNDNSNEPNEPTADRAGVAPDAPGDPTPAGPAGTGAGGPAEAAEATAAPAKRTARKSAAKKSPAKKSTVKKTTVKRTAKKAAAGDAPADDGPAEGAAAEGTAAAGGAEISAEPAGADQPDGAPAKKTAAKKTTKKTAAKKTAAKRTTKKAAAKAATTTPEEEAAAEQPAPDEAALTGGEAAVEPPAAAAPLTAAEAPGQTAAVEESDEAGEEPEDETGTPPAPAVLFKAPEKAPTRRRRRAGAAEAAEGDEAASAEERSTDRTGAGAASSTEETVAAQQAADGETATPGEQDDNADEGEDEQGSGGGRRRRRRGGRRRRKGNGGDSAQDADQKGDHDGSGSSDEADEAPKGKGRGTKGPKGPNGNDGDESSDDESGSSGSRRRRRRRRSGEEGDGGSDDPDNTVTRVRKARNPEDEITALQGSTRLEAKKQRRREGREAGRRRAPIVSEAEFLARRESVDRVMAIRQKKDLTQIAVLEDKVLVEHYVARESQTSLIGNVYLGRVQNVLPSMEAAFIDIGKGRNAVLYAGEVNWDALGAGNGPRKIEQVLKSGQPVLVQVTKDPIGHKGARLTSQISLPGRFLVYVPDGTTSGISRKLPDTERNRLKTLLKEIVPDSAGVIVRTAAEGASEDELTRDVERLTARWEDIAAKAEKGNAPQLLYGEPDLTLKVVRDLFTEDFGKLVVSGDDAWDMVEGYVAHVAPDLADRLERYDDDGDVFAAYRIDEQIAKALDRKVWLPSGGSLIIDRTEAMTVVDVNTGKFTGSGGNLEETVTKNNLEAAEEIVRQLRLRDIGGIIVIDFIDMVLESNRDLVLRRLVECLGRDRTRHQVAEVTSLGLVQMTRKRIGTGLVEAFSEPCEHCGGRGLLVHHEPVEQRKKVEEEPRRGRRGRGRKGEEEHEAASAKSTSPSPKDVAAMARPEPETTEPEATEPETPGVSSEAARAAEPEEAAETAEVPEAPVAQSAGRGRRRPAKQHGVPETAPPTPEPTPAAAPATAQAPQQPAEQAEPEEPVAPVAPTVVTTSRRRVARRPAGPPTAVAVAGNGGPSAGPATPEGSTPNGTGPDGAAAPGGGSTGEGQEEAGTVEAVAAAHVPVKKKGARKR